MSMPEVPEHFDLKRLRYFIAVAGAGCFGRAAERRILEAVLCSRLRLAYFQLSRTKLRQEIKNVE
jgi:hypothetical protein